MKTNNLGKSSSRLVFIFRLSAIGDIVIASRSVKYFVANNYIPVFVSMVSFKSILPKILNLRYFICFDENYNPYYYIDNLCVDKDKFLQVLESYTNIEQTTVFCDLQNRKRSHRARRILRKQLFNNQHVTTYKVRNHTLDRFFLIMCSFFSFNQKERNLLRKPIFRVHDRNLALINTIFRNDNLQLYNTHSKAQFLSSSSCQPDIKYVCLFPGASGKLKEWPLQHFKKLVNLILKNTDYDVYICGGQEDESLGLNFSGYDSRLHNKLGQNSLFETFDIISCAKYVICNDSFAAHVADAYSIPAIVLFGPTSPKFGFVPISSKIKTQYLNLNCSPCSRHGKGTCRFNNKRCLSSINPNMIFELFYADVHN